MARQVVVTGGGTGIGYAVAEAFVKAGDEVVVTGRREHVLRDAVARLGERARSVAFDATDPEAVARALDALPGTVDVLVNNAGGNTDFDREGPADGDLAGIAAAWRAMLDANVLSAVLVTEALKPRLAAGARVVSIGSIAAHTGAGAYGAAKAAVEAWNVTLAGALGPRGGTANVVAPGLIEGTEFFRGRLSGERRERLVAATATGRAGTPEDVAAVVAFLASPEAGHVTGQVVHCNGGAHTGR
jgi:3-oxoacyl-[acyl-carrier protein] reductase